MKKHKNKDSKNESVLEAKPKAKRTPAPLAEVERDDLLELGEKFQVPCGGLFVQTRKPSFTINNRKVNVNAASLEYFPDVEYMLPLIDPTDKLLALLPSDEEDVGSLKWCAAKDGKRSPKPITCPGFIIKLARMMAWKPEQLYKVVGRCINNRGLRLLLFDLPMSRPHKRELRKGKDAKTMRLMWVPVELEDGFGPTLGEHRKRLKIKTFEKFTVLGADENPAPELPL